MNDPLTRTVAAAHAVLAGSDDVDVRISAIAEYVAALGEILRIIESSGNDADKPTSEELSPLAELHSKVIENAVALLGSTSAEMKSLQSKGKAILAYTDTMPKRVSVRPQKKW